MAGIDVTEEKWFDQVMVRGRPALFTLETVDKSTVPDGLYCYELQYDTEMSVPTMIWNHAPEKFCGTIITADPFRLYCTGYTPVGYGNFEFTDQSYSVTEFAEKMERCHRNGVLCSRKLPDEIIVDLETVQSDMPEIEVNGRPGLFSEYHININTIPEGMYAYEVKGEDDGVSFEVTGGYVEQGFFGTVLTTIPFADPHTMFFEPVEKGRLSFNGKHSSVFQFLERAKDMVCVAAYYRTNNLEDYEDQIREQEKMVRAYCKKEGMVIVKEVRERCSGSRIGAGLLELAGSLSQTGAVAIVAGSYDRITRNMTDFMKLMGKLQEQDIQMISAKSTSYVRSHPVELKKDR